MSYLTSEAHQQFLDREEFRSARREERRHRFKLELSALWVVVQMTWAGMFAVTILMVSGVLK